MFKKLTVLAIIINIFIGLWVHGNVEDIISSYNDQRVVLPKWPFVVGSCLTYVVGLPAAIVTEIWQHCLDPVPRIAGGG